MREQRNTQKQIGNTKHRWQRKDLDAIICLNEILIHNLTLIRKQAVTITTIQP